MLSIAFKRLWNRSWLTLLSIIGVALAVGLATGIPIFAQAVSFAMLQEELDENSRRTRRPPFAIRVYVLPSGQYALSMQDCAFLENHVAETISSEVGVPLLSQSRQMETTGLVLRTRDEETSYGPPNTILLKDTNLTIVPGAASRLTIIEGQPMDSGTSTGDGLEVWIHQTIADETGIQVGEKFEARDLRRGISVPVRIVGTWRTTDPTDPFWFSNPEMSLRRALLVREADYETIAESAFEQQLGFVSWYIILDDSKLTAEQMQAYADGLNAGAKIISKYLPDSRIDSSPLEALENAIERESTLTVLMFVFSVPVMGFLLYFLSLISTITIRWQERETAVMASRGMRSGQLLTVGIIEAGVVIGLGTPLGLLTGIQLARLMGYTESFMQFIWRAPLPISPTSFSMPLLLAAISATLLARLWPTLRSARTSVVAHERARARAPHKPFWQRFYLDFVLLIPVAYAYRQLATKGTLVPEMIGGESGAGEDPLLFVVPALFTLTLSLLLVRAFPILMRIGDWLSALGRQSTLYLAFRQLARQSAQYTSALLLVITSLSLGAFMASMAMSLDQWLVDQVHYAVGSDVLIRQTVRPEEGGGSDPFGGSSSSQGTAWAEGAWVLPVTDYLEVPGVTDAARVGMYPATLSLGGNRTLKGTFIGVDRLDVPDVLFFRPDFGAASLGEMMNWLAAREDAVLLSERTMERGAYQVGDKISIRVLVTDILVESEFTIAGTFEYFPTVYEDEKPAVIGNLNFLFELVGATMLHDIWLKIEPHADRFEMIENVEEMGVYIGKWVDAREEVAKEQAKVERIGIFGTLTIGFLAAAVLSGIGLLVYNYASLQERLFRFTILRAVGLSLVQVVSQVAIEYIVLMVYSVAGGATIGVLSSKLFIPFFQAADKNVLRPPMMIPLIAWQDIGRISGAFTIVLVFAQIVVISAALRKGVFQALRMGDQE
jgi:putative ABC transport system permease protein